MTRKDFPDSRLAYYLFMLPTLVTGALALLLKPAIVFADVNLMPQLMHSMPSMLVCLAVVCLRATNREGPIHTTGDVILVNAALVLCHLI